MTPLQQGLLLVSSNQEKANAAYDTQTPPPQIEYPAGLLDSDLLAMIPDGSTGNKLLMMPLDLLAFNVQIIRLLRAIKEKTDAVPSAPTTSTK